jgi:hypothetical protein
MTLGSKRSEGSSFPVSRASKSRGGFNLDRVRKHRTFGPFGTSTFGRMK